MMDILTYEVGTLSSNRTFMELKSRLVNIVGDFYSMF